MNRQTLGQQLISVLKLQSWPDLVREHQELLELLQHVRCGLRLSQLKTQSWRQHTRSLLILAKQLEKYLPLTLEETELMTTPLPERKTEKFRKLLRKVLSYKFLTWINWRKKVP